MSVLLIAPQDQQAWLVGPDHEAARDGVPLCASHADRVTVPFGWQLRDDRPVAKPRARRKSRARKARSEPQPQPEPVAESAPIAETDAAPSAPTRRSAEKKATAQPGGAQPEPAPPAPVAAAAAAESASAAPAADDSAEADEPATPESAGVEPGPTASSEAETPNDTVVNEPAPAHTDAASGEVAAGEVAAGAESVGSDRHHAPADVPVHADDVAASFAGSGARLTVVPGDDDPSKTFTVEPDGQTALWAESQREDHEPGDETPLLKRAFRVVRED